ncbi:hypothetical protein [Stenotrophomonas maltophilia]|uniref:hypothetical protein n=1 Tax=Stenotrophomonas maltophilia group TaxID=995085 RepID=UPI000A696D31|nr:hypothetical protein [Stenotrophomonas maltophilia]NNH47609.1 hypothetical protein [Stenotrophomonas maltophilia]VEE53956.1 Uncharacterised protein [Stenotrophomonas maltophilia]
MAHNDLTLEKRILALREERSGLHPDKNGGEFVSPAAQKRYLEIEDELDQLRSQGETSGQELIPLSQLPALIEALNGSAQKHQASAKELEREFKRSATQDISRRYLTPKISSGVAAAVVAFLFTQAPSLAEHPFLGRFFASPSGMVVLAYAFAISLALLAWSWIRERAEASLIARLTSRSILVEVGSHLDILPRGHLIEEAELRELMFKNLVRRRSLVLYRVLDEEMLDGAFEMQLQRLVERRVLKESAKRSSVDRVFEKL